MQNTEMPAGNRGHRVARALSVRAATSNPRFTVSCPFLLLVGTQDLGHKPSPSEPVIKELQARVKHCAGHCSFCSEGAHHPVKATRVTQVTETQECQLGLREEATPPVGDAGRGRRGL